MRVAGLVIVFFAAPGVRAFLSSGIVMSVDTSQFVGMSECPRIGLGLAALGRPGYINLQRNAEIGDKESRSVEAMREQSYQVMDAAWASGIRYFDAARSYGKAEEFLEGWLRSRKIAPSEVAVGSKWGYRYTADWRIDTGNEPHEVKDHSAAHFQTQQAETLGLLSEYLNLYQIHSATIESGVLEDAAVLTLLRDFKRNKGIRLGLSLSGVKQAVTLRKALEIPLDPSSEGSLLGARLFDCVQATYNCAEQSVGPALLEARKVKRLPCSCVPRRTRVVQVSAPAAGTDDNLTHEQAGVDVIIKEAMANGRLLKGAKAARIQACADRLGVSPDALCLAAVMVQEFRPMVLSGAATPQQVQSNAAALALADKVLSGEDKSARSELDALLHDTVMAPDAYWAERAALAWN